MRAFSMVVAVFVTMTASAAGLPYAAPILPITDDYFGTKVVDNYRWMENLQDPDMQRWMKAQADYTRASLEELPGYPALLKRVELLNSSQPSVVSSVQIVGGRYYSLRMPKDAQSPKLYVRVGVNGKDNLLIDPEMFAGNDKSHFNVHDYRPSPDGRYVAYLVAAGGGEDSVLRILNVKTGQDLAETADRIDGDITAPFWRTDSRSFFYSRNPKLAPGTLDAVKRQNKPVYLHALGRSFDDDPPIVGRGVSDAAFQLMPLESPEIVTAPSSHYAVAIISLGTDRRLRVYAAPISRIKDSHTTWRPVAASYDDDYVGFDGPDAQIVALSGDTLYWMSHKDAPRGQIMRLDLARADSRPEVIVPQSSLPISVVYAGRDAIYWRANDSGSHAIRRLRLVEGARPEALALPYSGDVTDIIADDKGDAAVLHVNSFLHSPAYLGIDPGNGVVTDTGLQPSGPFDRPSDLAVDEVQVKSWDGTLVPLSIVHKKGLKRDGSNTAQITGYGAYGISMSPFYLPAMQAWYDHAQIIAFAHVRGGGELGETWHKAGQKDTKSNTWKDFIACAQYLVDNGYTKPAKLFAWAQSAGGILIGRAIEERPDLFGAVVSRVPVADMLRNQTTTNGPDNIPEFGDVNTPEGFKALYEMSPYAHVQDAGKYPPMMVYAGINDQRVAAWIPAKFAARMQAATVSGKPVLLRVDYDAGHTGMDATRAQLDRDRADMFGFALWQTGDADFQPGH